MIIRQTAIEKIGNKLKYAINNVEEIEMMFDEEQIENEDDVEEINEIYHAMRDMLIRQIDIMK